MYLIYTNWFSFHIGLKMFLIKWILHKDWTFSRSGLTLSILICLQSNIWLAIIILAICILSCTFFLIKCRLWLSWHMVQVCCDVLYRITQLKSANPSYTVLGIEYIAYLRVSDVMHFHTSHTINQLPNQRYIYSWIVVYFCVYLYLVCSLFNVSSSRNLFNSALKVRVIPFFRLSPKTHVQGVTVWKWVE